MPPETGNGQSHERRLAMSSMTGAWQVWDQATSYGHTLYRRAVGELPEMESAKKMAREVGRVFHSGDSILDVGCGAGHYLPSLRRVINTPFAYHGIDATENYVALAKKAFAGQPNAEFSVGSIFDLDLPDRSYDVVMCNNVLLHMPSIARPLSELVRVARRKVLVRFLCGQRSFIIQDVHPQADGEEFDSQMRPVGFHYYNIYSQAYVHRVISDLKGVESWTITPDTDYDQQRILESATEHGAAHDASGIAAGYQVNGYILQPWAVLEITRTSH
jgi:ubiquinone/menaquinone biosynthesis C-methylase UbiE